MLQLGYRSFFLKKKGTCCNIIFDGFFLHFAGYDVYLVGGCVRDLIMKKTPKDFDIITTADLRQVIIQITKLLILMK